MRLIDADAIQIPSTYVDLFENCRNCKLLDREQVREIIDNTPTIEPKRGEWLERNSGFIKWIRCSACNHRIYQGTKTNFCPNCGARMKGADDES